MNGNNLVGSAVLDAPAKLGKIVTGMSRALGEIPVTIKLRTGVKDGRNNAHKIMLRAATEWGVGCITVCRHDCLLIPSRFMRQRIASWPYAPATVHETG